jgi:hypothetical protein
MAADVLSGKLDAAVLDSVSEELFRLSEGEPFVLTLYLQQLAEIANQDVASLVQRLRTLEPGLGACFRDWWSQQSAVWERRGVNQETLVAILGALSTACGPMTVDDIQAVIGRSQTGYVITAALKQLQRFIIATARGDRVTVFHERLAEFVKTALMSAADVEEQQQRFIEWGLSAIAAHAAVTESASVTKLPEYVLRHLASHVYGRDVDIDRLTPMLRKRWADAWLDLEGNHSGFLSDVNGILRRAIELYRLSPKAELRRRAFLVAVDSIVVRGSAISVAESLPPQLLTLLLGDKLWNSAQVLAYIRTIQKSDKKLAAMMAIADTLDPAYHATYVDAALTLDDGRLISFALASLAARVAAPKSLAFLQAVGRLRSPTLRAQALAAFHSSDNLNREAALKMLADARATADENLDLAHLAFAEAHLSPDQRDAKLAEALVHVRAITSSEGFISGLGLIDKVRLLCTLATEFDDVEMSPVLAREALATLRSWTEINFARITFSTSCSTIGKWVFPEALEYARRLDQERDDSDALLSLVGTYDANRWPDFASEIRSIVDATISSVTKVPDYRFYFDTLRLHAQLGAEQLVAFTAAIESMADDEYRWKSQIIRLKLTETNLRQGLARELFEKCLKTPKESWSAEVLAEIAAYLPGQFRADAIQATLIASRTIHDEYSCDTALMRMAQRIENSEEPLSDDVVQRLLAWPTQLALDVRLSRSVMTQALLVDTLIGLQNRTQGGVWNDTADDLQHRSDYWKHKALIALASYVTTESALTQYRACAATISDDNLRVGALFALLGTVSAEVLDSAALGRWLAALPYEAFQSEAMMNQKTTPEQAAFLVEHLGEIADDRLRIVVGGLVESELHSRGAWPHHFADVLDIVRNTEVFNFGEPSWCRAAINGCDTEEIIKLVDAAQGHFGSSAYCTLLARAIDRIDAEDLRDELAIRLLAEVREMLNDPAPWADRDVMDKLETLSQLRISGRIVLALDEFCSATLSDWRQKRVQKHLASRFSESRLASYIESAMSVWPPGERIELLAPVFSRLTLADRATFFQDATEWMETYSCSSGALFGYMKMSELCAVDTRDTVAIVIAQMELDARIGASVTPVEAFLRTIDTWRSEGRIGWQQAHEILGALVTDITAHERSDVVAILEAMSGWMEPLAETAVPDVMNVMAAVLAEWP